MPAEHPVEVPIVLRDGTEGLIRDLRLADKETLEEEYERLSPESRYHRFLTAIPHLSERMLTQLVDKVDFVDHVALGMLVDHTPDIPDDDFRPVGLARVIRFPDEHDTADVAVTVIDEYQGRGVATALLAELMRQRPDGITKLSTIVASDNEPSLAMLRRLGPTTVSEPHDGVFDVEVQLPAKGDSPAQ